MATADPGFAQPLDDDFETEVLPVRWRPRLAPLTAVLALCVVAGAAFIGGVEVQKANGGSSASAATGSGRFAAARNAAAAARSGRGAGASNGAFPGAGAFTAGDMTVGLVTLIKGTTLYVTDLTGNTVKVRTAPGMQVSKTVSTTVKGIHPGDSVVVRGTKQKDGSTKASSVSIGTSSGPAAVTGG